MSDISLAGAALGYSPRVGLEEGLKRLVEWFRRAGKPLEEIEVNMDLKQKILGSEEQKLESLGSATWAFHWPWSSSGPDSWSTGSI